MTFSKTFARSTCGLLLLLALTVVSAKPIETWNLFPNSVDRKIPVPAQSTNPFFDVSYGGVVFDMSRFLGRDRWLVSVEVVTDEHYAHHSVGYTLDFGSPFSGPGGPFNEIEDGAFVPDTLGVSGFNGIWGTQGGFNGVNFLHADIDNSTANGYRYGIPWGAQTMQQYLVVQVHLHNPEAIPDLRVPFKLTVKTSTIAPVYDVGLVFNGAIGQQTVFDLREDGTAVFEGRTEPSYLSCMTPGAEDCANCCNTTSTPVYPASDQPFSHLMQVLNIPEAWIIGGFVHAHSLQKKVEFGVVPFEGGNDQMIYECDGCGHNHMTGEQKSAWQWLEEPVHIRAGDGFLARCTYERHHGNTNPIQFGFKTEQEMCNGFFYIAHERTALRKPAFIPELGLCASTINDGYWISNPFVREALGCNRPQCAQDPVCNPTGEGLPMVM